MNYNDAWMNMFKNMSAYMLELKDIHKQVIGVDWAEDSGMNRGEVIKREENVVHVRFKTVTF